MSRHFDIQYDHLNPVGFNGIGHIHNFYHYLFRTGGSKKLETEKTNDNICLLYHLENDEYTMKSFGISTEDRQDCKKEAYKLLMPLLKKYGEDIFFNDIVYLDVLENNKIVSSELTNEEWENIIRMLMKELYENVDTILFVLHLDQEGTLPHIHTMFIR